MLPTAHTDAKPTKKHTQKNQSQTKKNNRNFVIYLKNNFLERAVGEKTTNQGQEEKRGHIEKLIRVK